MKVPNLSPLKMFAPALPRPALTPAGAGGNVMFARGEDDDGYDYPDHGSDVDQPTSRTRRVTRDTSSRSRSSGGDGGRQRSIQFQPEERYWTDYLRIALPIIGLLLMVGLFWYWVQMLIDEPSASNEPAPTATTQGQPELALSGSTPAPTEPAVTGGQPPVAGATPPPAEETPPNDTADETEPADAVTDDQLFAPDDTARINQPDVNMRAEPTIGEAGVINATLEADTLVTIRSGPEEADGLQWWEIVVDETGETGWVAQDYLEPEE